MSSTKQAAAAIPEHPSVDSTPRKDQSSAADQIDFNDPYLSCEEAVEKNLADQGK